MNCLTPESYKILKGIAKLSEAEWSKVMEVWESNPDNLGYPTYNQAMDIRNKLFNGKNSEIQTLQEGSQKLLVRLIKRKKGVLDTLDSKQLDPKLKPKLTENVKILEEQIKELEDQINTDLNEATMFKIANSHLDLAETWLNQEVISSREFDIINSYLELYKMFATDYIPKKQRKMLTEEGEMDSYLYQEGLGINSRVDKLSIKMADLEADAVVDVASSLRLNIGSKEELLAPTKDIGWFEANLRPMGMVGNKILTIMSSIANFADNKATQLQNKYNDLVQEAFKDLKDSPLFQAKGYDIMYVKDKKGRVIGTTSRYNQSYYDEREAMNTMLANAPEDKKKEAWIKWKKWQDSNHKTYSIFKAYNLETGEIVDPELLDRAKNSLIESFGPALGEEYFNEAVKKVDKYLDESRHFKEHYGNTPEGIKDFQLWEMSHNPIIANANTGFLTVDGKHIPNRSYQYLVVRPIEKHIDHNYNDIMSDEKYAKAFKAYQKVVGDYMSSLPPSFITNYGITKNFIPYVRKSVWDSFKTEGWGLGIKEFQRAAYEKARDSKESGIIYSEVSENGNSSMSIPIHYMIPATIVDEETGEVVTDVKAQQLDPERLLLTIIPQVAQYQYKTMLQPAMSQIKRVVDGMKEEVGLDENGVPIPAKGLDMVKKLAQYNMEVFGGKANDKVSVTNKRLMTKDEIAVLEAESAQGEATLNKFIAEVNADESLSPEERSEMIKTKGAVISSKLRAKEKNFSFGQTVRSLLKYYSLKTLGFSVTTSINEFVQGTSSIMIHAAGGEDFTFKQWGDALKSSRTAKDTALRKLYDINPANINGEETQSKFEKFGNWMTEQADTTSKGAVFAAKMKNTILEGIDGPVSLYDAYDENGVWRSELFSEEVNKEWSPSLDADLVSNRFFDFQAQVKELNMRLFGAYDKQAHLMAKRSTWGKALMMFKTWIGEAYAIRFESRKESLVLGRNVKGRWRSLYDVYSVNGLIPTMNALFTGRTDKLQMVDGDLDVANIRKDMVEMYILLTCIALSTIAALAIDDEDDEDSVGYMAGIFTINMVGRLQQDLTYFANPGEAKKLQDNLLPILRLSKDFVDVSNSFVKTIDGDTEVTQGVFRGWNRIGKESAELLPVTNTAMKMYSTFKQDKSEID